MRPEFCLESDSRTKLKKRNLRRPGSNQHAASLGVTSVQDMFRGSRRWRYRRSRSWDLRTRIYAVWPLQDGIVWRHRSTRSFGGRCCGPGPERFLPMESDRRRHSSFSHYLDAPNTAEFPATNVSRRRNARACRARSSGTAGIVHAIGIGE